jgi:hypothetical protein
VSPPCCFVLQPSGQCFVVDETVRRFRAIYKCETAHIHRSHERQSDRSFGRAERNGLTVLVDEDIVAPAHDPQDANPIVAGTYGRGVFWSSDGGVDWSRIELDVEDVRTVAFSDCQQQTVFATCSEGGLLYSDVRKVNWRVVESDAMVECSILWSRLKTQERQTRRPERER